MIQWMANGTRLAWFFDPYKQSIYIYRKNQPEPEIIHTFDTTLNGEAVLPIFQFDANILK